MSTPLFDCVVDHVLVHAFPFLNDTLSQLVQSLDFLAVNSLAAEEHPVPNNQPG